MDSIRLTEIKSRVESAAERAGRDPSSITLVVVTKSAAPDQIRAAYEQGHRDFGENRAAGLLASASMLPNDARWHFIGRLQGNKVRRIRPAVHLLHSLDRPELVDYWLKGPGAPPPVLVQVNVGGEAQKGGRDPGTVAGLVDAGLRLGLDVRGLMTIPPRGTSPEDARPWFRALARLGSELSRERPGLVELSMGMTEDFEVAVEEGATLLRVGRAIFGPFDDPGLKR
jgi:pyridoxal phosphate enzyme (YggS family)